MDDDLRFVLGALARRVGWANEPERDDVLALIAGTHHVEYEPNEEGEPGKAVVVENDAPATPEPEPGKAVVVENDAPATPEPEPGKAVVVENDAPATPEPEPEPVSS